MIAKEIGENKYRTIYCHNDGYLSHNGKVLSEHYNTPEKVDELLELGDISLLGGSLLPGEPGKAETEENATIAYARDVGEKKTEARVLSSEELLRGNYMQEYVYVYTKEGRWIYCRCGTEKDEFRDVETDLERLGLRETVQSNENMETDFEIPVMKL